MEKGEPGHPGCGEAPLSEPSLKGGDAQSRQEAGVSFAKLGEAVTSLYTITQSKNLTEGLRNAEDAAKVCQTVDGNHPLEKSLSETGNVLANACGAIATVLTRYNTAMENEVNLKLYESFMASPSVFLSQLPHEVYGSKKMLEYIADVYHYRQLILEHGEVFEENNPLEFLSDLVSRKSILMLKLVHLSKEAALLVKSKH